MAAMLWWKQWQNVSSRLLMISLYYLFKFLHFSAHKFYFVDLHQYYQRKQNKTKKPDKLLIHGLTCKWFNVQIHRPVLPSFVSTSTKSLIVVCSRSKCMEEKHFRRVCSEQTWTSSERYFDIRSNTKTTKLIHTEKLSWKLWENNNNNNNRKS